MTNSELIFFFSSRRRHTRFDCDWSSDVCSSDLWPGGDDLLTIDDGVSVPDAPRRDRKSTRLNSSHSQISYAVFCLKKKNDPACTSQTHNPNAMPTHVAIRYPQTLVVRDLSRRMP